MKKLCILISCAWSLSNFAMQAPSEFFIRSNKPSTKEEAILALKKVYDEVEEKNLKPIGNIETGAMFWQVTNVKFNGKSCHRAIYYGLGGHVNDHYQNMEEGFMTTLGACDVGLEKEGALHV